MIALYPNSRKSPRENFTKVKISVVPNQSMTLRDIIKRFMRRESLPIEQNGVYHENLGDLEKLARQDIFVRVERAKQLENYISSAASRMEKLKTPPPSGSQGDGVIVPDAGSGGGSPDAGSGGGKGAASATPLAQS